MTDPEVFWQTDDPAMADAMSLDDDDQPVFWMSLSRHCVVTTTLDYTDDTGEGRVGS